jgi:hypothetical protein
MSKYVIEKMYRIVSENGSSLTVERGPDKDLFCIVNEVGDRIVIELEEIPFIIEVLHEFEKEEALAKHEQSMSASIDKINEGRELYEQHNVTNPPPF